MSTGNPPPDPTGPPLPYLGPRPCPKCGDCSGWQPCFDPPYGCGGPRYCATCAAKASRIAQGRAMIDGFVMTMPDSHVLDVAAAMGLQVPT